MAGMPDDAGAGGPAEAVDHEMASSRIVRHACHDSSGAFPADLFSSFSKTIRYSSQPGIWLGAILIGYCFGCLDMAWLLAFYKGLDIKALGNGNAGASNALIHDSSGAFPADLFSSFSKTIRYSSQRYVQAAQIL